MWGMKEMTDQEFASLTDSSLNEGLALAKTMHFHLTPMEELTKEEAIAAIALTIHTGMQNFNERMRQSAVLNEFRRARNG